MICRSCDAEIADKAIVCYRCGAPTATADDAARRAGVKGPALWPWILAFLAIVAAVVYFLALKPAA